MIDVNQPVKDIVAARPESARVFEAMGIDYCCGGDKPFQEACKSAQVSADEVLKAIESIPASAVSSETRDWNREPLASLMAQIVSQHHAYCRREGERVGLLLEKTVEVHGARHPELRQIQSVFLKMNKELGQHLMKEEITLFPLIEQMERAAASGQPMPRPAFGTIENPVSMMILEHDGTGADLKEMRRLSNGYAPPEDACTTYRSLYTALKEFEQDMHQHVYLENYVLFPRTVALEKRLDAMRAGA